MLRNRGIPSGKQVCIEYQSANLEGVVSQFEVKCPMCKGTLIIDPVTQKVVEHKTPEHQKASFDDFLKNQKKGVAWDEKMKKAKEDEAKRKSEIENKFKEAKDIVIDPEEKESMRSPFDWD
jgi:phage FluMu protein Com